MFVFAKPTSALTTRIELLNTELQRNANSPLSFAKRRSVFGRTTISRSPNSRTRRAT